MSGEEYGPSRASLESWANMNLSEWGKSRVAQSNVPNTGGPGSTASSWVPNSQGQYLWYNGQWSNRPEGRVPTTTDLGYQTGSGVYPIYTYLPETMVLNQGIASLSDSGTALLQKAASNYMGWDASKNWPMAMGQTWEYAVQRAIQKNVDPMSILAEIASGNSQFGSMSSSSSSYGGGGGGGGGGGTTTVTTTQLTNPDAAKRLINQAMTSYLGREATKQEISRFVKSLNAEERANPTVQTMTMDGSGQVQTVEGGMDAAQFSQDYAQSRPDYAEYRAATDLMDTFLGILQGPVR